MPSDAWSPDLKTSHKSLESLKQVFKQRLETILHKQLTVENIETFANEALSEIISLTDDVLEEYRNNPNVHLNQIPLNKQEQENEAFSKLDLPNIQEILKSIIAVKEEINSLKTYIHTNTESINTVITPPQPDRIPEIEGGSGTFVEKKTFPRLLTLLYILEHDFDIAPSAESVSIKEGIVKKDMMRKTPYVRVEIPELDRVVYICDEEGNVSYVFDTKILKEKSLTLEEVDIDDKGDKNSLIAYHPGIGIRMKQTKYWRSRIAAALREPIPEIQTNLPEEHERQFREGLSEFRESKEWLPFEDFQNEVKKFYPGKIGVYNWYQVERKNHSRWPSKPYITYQDEWVSWPALVEKKWPPFEKFQTEVRSFYSEQENASKWYREERVNHPTWPISPYSVYKDNWKGWSELVGKENPHKKEWLQFEDFQKEVRSLYPGHGDVERWYRKERKNHPNWPSNPFTSYKDHGWEGFPELVEKENFLDKEYVSFEVFQTEARKFYPGEVNVFRWYLDEWKKHPGWPSNPQKTYVANWKGWTELVEKENRKKIQFPSFKDLQAEIREFYPGHGDIQKWYQKERKNHTNWPANLPRTYQDEWVSWPALVE